MQNSLEKEQFASTIITPCDGEKEILQTLPIKANSESMIVTVEKLPVNVVPLKEMGI